MTANNTNTVRNQKEELDCAIRKADHYLKGYLLNKKLLRLDRYEKEFLGAKQNDSAEFFGEGALARARMFEIRHFIMELANSDEKLFLYYHYIKGESVERCGELLGIARSSAFRMKRRALALVAKAKEDR